MLLRTRIILIFGLATLSLLTCALTPLWVMQGLADDALAQSRGEEQSAAWSAALNGATTPYEILSAHLAADPTLRQAVQANNAAATHQVLADAQARAGITRLDLISADGRLLASSAGMAAETPIIDTTNLRNRLARDPWLIGVEAEAGKVLVVVTTAFPDGMALSLAAPAEPVLTEMARGGARRLFLVDRAETLLLSTSADDWPALSAARATASGRAMALERNGYSFDVIATPLLTTVGLQIATLISMRDVTAASQRGSLVMLLTGGATVLVFASLVLALYGFIKGALDPLSEITRVIRAMAAGDATVSADIPDRRDEVGAIATAVEVFRRNIVTLARTKLSTTLRQAQQQALIRREMAKLGSMLEPSEQEDLLADLREIEAANEDGSALAEGFRRMAARVVAQHTRLATLLAERTRDLDTVRQALSERAQLSRLRQELEVARHLQLSSLPQIFPPFPDRTDFEIYAAMEPAKEVGGDFYDFALIGGDRLAVMIGDASGKGVSAAMFIAMGRSILRSAIVRGASPAQALALANSTLSVENHTMMFATVFAAVLDLRTGWLTYASAGHNPPYLVAEGVGVQPLGGETGIALGIMEDAEYIDGDILVPQGASIVLFTDGVTEAHDLAHAMYGEELLEAALARLQHAGPEAVVRAIQAEVLRFANGAEQADDITVLSARYLGPVQLLASQDAIAATPAKTAAGVRLSPV